MTTKFSEFKLFDNAMSTILRADPKAVKQAMEAKKRENAKKRKAKKKPSASDRVGGDAG
jgi:hypothetical protein